MSYLPYIRHHQMVGLGPSPNPQRWFCPDQSLINPGGTGFSSLLQLTRQKLHSVEPIKSFVYPARPARHRSATASFRPHGLIQKTGRLRRKTAVLKTSGRREFMFVLPSSSSKPDAELRPRKITELQHLRDRFTRLITLIFTAQQRPNKCSLKVMDFGAIYIKKKT